MECSGISISVSRQVCITCICCIQKHFEFNGQQFKHLLWFVLILIEIAMGKDFSVILYCKVIYFLHQARLLICFCVSLKVFSKPPNKRSTKITFFRVGRDQCFRGTCCICLWVDFLCLQDGEMCSFSVWSEHSSSLFGALTAESCKNVLVRFLPYLLHVRTWATRQ
jgi:hypothetical protein